MKINIAQIKEGFNSKIFKWIGGLIGLLVITLMVRISIMAQRVIEAPKKLDELKQKFDAKAVKDSTRFIGIEEWMQLQVNNARLLQEGQDSLIYLFNEWSRNDVEFRQDTRQMFGEIRQQLYKN